MTADQIFYLAIFSGFSAIVSPVLMSWITEHNRAKARIQDYVRQDEIARQAREATEEVAVQAKRAAELLVESNARVAETAKKQGAQLQQIHTLVNSNMTLEMQKGLASHKALLALLLRLAPEETAQIGETQRLITEIEAQLADRQKQTEIADTEVEQAEKPKGES